MEAAGGRTPPSAGWHQTRPISAAPAGQDAKSLYNLRYQQPYDGPYETPPMFFNGKISDPGNIPSSPEEGDELANGRLQ